MKRELLKEYLLDNTDVMRHIVVELNCWNGSLEDLEVWENDEEFFNTFFYNNPAEVARAISFGDYNYNDCYVRFNGYGNLETLSRYEYDDELKDRVEEIIDCLEDNYSNVYVYDNYVKECIEEEEEEEEE